MPPHVGPVKAGWSVMILLGLVLIALAAVVWSAGRVVARIVEGEQTTAWEREMIRRGRRPAGQHAGWGDRAG